MKFGTRWPPVPAGILIGISMLLAFVVAGRGCAVDDGARLADDAVARVHQVAGDALDAAVVAWSAARIARGTARSFPEGSAQVRPGGGAIVIHA